MKDLCKILDYLQVFFIVFKLTGIIDWNWWAVLSPLWLVIVFGMLLSISNSMKKM